MKIFPRNKEQINERIIENKPLEIRLLNKRNKQTPRVNEIVDYFKQIKFMKILEQNPGAGILTRIPVAETVIMSIFENIFPRGLRSSIYELECQFDIAICCHVS